MMRFSEQLYVVLCYIDLTEKGDTLTLPVNVNVLSIPPHSTTFPSPTSPNRSNSNSLTESLGEQITRTGMPSRPLQVIRSNHIALCFNSSSLVEYIKPINLPLLFSIKTLFLHHKETTAPTNHLQNEALPHLLHPRLPRPRLRLCHPPTRRRTHR